MAGSTPKLILIRRETSASSGVAVSPIQIGKVVVADGSVFTESALILTVCNGRKHTETHTDSQGNFSFQWGSSFADSDRQGSGGRWQRVHRVGVNPDRLQWPEAHRNSY